MSATSQALNCATMSSQKICTSTLTCSRMWLSNTFFQHENCFCFSIPEIVWWLCNLNNTAYIDTSMRRSWAARVEDEKKNARSTSNCELSKKNNNNLIIDFAWRRKFFLFSYRIDFYGESVFSKYFAIVFFSTSVFSCAQWRQMNYPIFSLRWNFLLDFLHFLLFSTI